MYNNIIIQEGKRHSEKMIGGGEIYLAARNYHLSRCILHPLVFLILFERRQRVHELFAESCHHRRLHTCNNKINYSFLFFTTGNKIKNLKNIKKRGKRIILESQTSTGPSTITGVGKGIYSPSLECIPSASYFLCLASYKE